MSKLVITRRSQESFLIGDNITVTIVEINGQQERIAIEAPKEINIVRTELIGKPRREQ